MNTSKQLMQKYLSNPLNDKLEVNSKCLYHAVLDFLSLLIITISSDYPKIFTS